MPQILVECTPSNCGYLILSGTMVVGSGLFNVSFLGDEGARVLIWFDITARIVSNFTVYCLIFSSESCLLPLIYCLLDSIVACMMMNC